MAVETGYSKIVTRNSVFAYDTGDTVNSWKGQPITNQQTVLGTSGFGAAADNNVTYPVNGTGTFVRLGYGQTFGGYTIQPSDVVYRYDLGSNGCHYHGFDTAIPAGTYATFTFDYLVANATNYPSTNFLANFELAFGGSASAPNSLQNVWQTVSFTGGPSGGSGTLRSLLYPGGCGGRLADSGYILYKNPQVTYTSYAVPFVQGTRSTTQGMIDIVGGNTINLVNMSYGANNAISFDGTDDYTQLTTSGLVNTTISVDTVIYIDSSKTYAGILGSNITEKYEMLIKDAANLEVSLSSGNYAQWNNILTTGTYIHLCLVAVSGTTWKLYKNGVDLGSPPIVGGSYVVNGTSVSNIDIGRIRNSSGFAYIGKIPIMKIYNRALTASEVLTNFNHYKTRFNIT